MSDTGWVLSDDKLTLTITRREPRGITTITLHRTQPFDNDTITTVNSLVPSASMEPGQRNTTRRRVTRFGTLWTHVMTGPPTWPLPRLRAEADGTVMIGWLRAATGG